MLTLYYVTGHQRSGILIALYASVHKVPFHLQTEQVPREFLFEPRRVWSVELDAEAKCRLKH